MKEKVKDVMILTCTALYVWFIILAIGVLIGPLYNPLYVKLTLTLGVISTVASFIIYVND